MIYDDKAINLLTLRDLREPLWHDLDNEEGLAAYSLKLAA